MMARHRRSQPRRWRARQARRGSTLVEIMIAMTVLVIGLTGLAGMTLHAARRSFVLAGATGRTAVQTEVLEQLTALPFNMLPSKVGCVNVAAMPYPHRRCVTVTDVAFRRREVRVVFTPTNRRLRADTLLFERARGVSTSALH